jgi:hypothetical protein
MPETPAERMEGKIGKEKPFGRGMKSWKREGDSGHTHWVQHRTTSGRYSCAPGLAILHYSLLSIPRPTGSGGSTLSDAALGTLSSLKLQSARTAPFFACEIINTGKKLKQADRPDSVTTGCPAMTAIHLGRELLHGSSFLPARSASSINACLFGIAPSGGYRVSPFVTLRAAFAAHVPKTRLCGPIPRLIPCGFRRTVINRHPALWSPDLPPAILR